MDQARVAWACRRGMLELDLILQPFYQNAYSNLQQEQRQAFHALLACEDDLLYDWLIRKQKTETEHAEIIQLITQHHDQTTR